MKFVKLPSPNFTAGNLARDTWGILRTVEAIVIHHWGVDGQKGANAAQWFLDPDSDVSAHELIDRDTVYQIVDWADIAWHAGSREWNAKTIGLELRPEADPVTIATARGRIAAIRKVHGPVPLVFHGDLKATDCPGRYRALLKQLEGDTPIMGTMVSPFEGRLTANHQDRGGYAGHKGMDIAPPSPGQTNRPIYAAFAGTVRRVHRGAVHGNRSSTWAPYRTGDGALISNPDGEGNGYNHMQPLDSLRVGDKVKAGQLIGYNDTSGNQSGPHLHFEMWGDWEDPNSDYDPRLAFDAHGVRPGSAPVGVSAPAKPTITPAKAKPSTSGNSRADNTAIQTALTEMGINVGRADGVDGSLMKAGVKFFQEAHDLYADGHWGPKTQAVFELNERIQQGLRDKGYNKQIVDGFYGAQTTANIRDWQKRKGLYVDGVAGSKTQKSLGI